MNFKDKKKSSKNIFLPSLLLILLVILVFALLPNKKEVPPVVRIEEQEKKEKIEKPEREMKVEAKNTPPIIKELKFKFENLENKNFLTVSINAEDKENDLITYKYEWKINNEIVSNEDKISDFKKGDQTYVSVTPFDGTNQGITKSLDIEIGNLPPVINEHNETIVEGDVIKYQVKAYDPDGDNLKFSFVNPVKNAKIDENTGLIEYKTSQNETKEKFEVKVSDQNGGEATYIFELGFVEEKK